MGEERKSYDEDNGDGMKDRADWLIGVERGVIWRG